MSTPPPLPSRLPSIVGRLLYDILRWSFRQAFQPEAFWSIKMEYAAEDPASPGGMARASFSWERVSTNRRRNSVLEEGRVCDCVPGGGGTV